MKLGPREVLLSTTLVLPLLMAGCASNKTNNVANEMEAINRSQVSPGSEAPWGDWGAQ